jgi:hypothetical protein
MVGPWLQEYDVSGVGWKKKRQAERPDFPPAKKKKMK